MKNKKRLIIVLLISGGVIVTASITGYKGYRQYRLRDLESKVRELVIKKDNLEKEIAEKKKRLEVLLNTPGGMYSQARVLTKNGNVKATSNEDLRQADILYTKLINAGHLVEKSKKELAPIREERASRRLSGALEEWPYDIEKPPEGSISTIGLNLTALIEEYPETEAAVIAKSKLKIVEKEIKEIEERRKYEPRTEEEAMAEWVNFRNNEKSMMGTITTWRFKIDYISGRESPLGHLGSYSDDMQVGILGPTGWTYLAASAVGKVPVLKEDDWVCITGRFAGVSSDGVVLLTPIRVINEGYQ